MIIYIRNRSNIKLYFKIYNSLVIIESDKIGISYNIVFFKKLPFVDGTERTRSQIPPGKIVLFSPPIQCLISYNPVNIMKDVKIKTNKTDEGNIIIEIYDKDEEIVSEDDKSSKMLN